MVASGLKFVVFSFFDYFGTAFINSPVHRIPYLLFGGVHGEFHRPAVLGFVIKGGNAQLGSHPLQDKTVFFRQIAPGRTNSNRLHDTRSCQFAPLNFLPDGPGRPQVGSPGISDIGDSVNQTFGHILCDLLFGMAFNEVDVLEIRQ